MGLDTSHGCWSGAYSGFHRWRNKLAEVAGYGNLTQYRSYGGTKEWPSHAESEDPLLVLLNHSDCDGEILAEDCEPLANALEALLPALERAGDGGGHVGSYAFTTKKFINGLRRAASLNDNVDFR